MQLKNLQAYIFFRSNFRMKNSSSAYICVQCIRSGRAISILQFVNSNSFPKCRAYEYCHYGESNKFQCNFLYISVIYTVSNCVAAYCSYFFVLFSYFLWTMAADHKSKESYCCFKFNANFFLSLSFRFVYKICMPFVWQHTVYILTLNQSNIERNIVNYDRNSFQLKDNTM